MNQTISNLITELAAHETQLRTELDELTTQCRSIADQLAQVQTALSALRGNPGSRPAKQDGAAKRDKATTSIVHDHVMAILASDGRLPVADLKSRVKSRLLAVGLSRVGFTALFSKALDSPALTIDENQCVSVASSGGNRERVHVANESHPQSR